MTPKYGREAAEELAKFEMAHVPAIKRLVEKENIDCDFHITRSFDVFLTESQNEKVRKDYDVLNQAGVTSVLDLHYTSGDKAERVSSSFSNLSLSILFYLYVHPAEINQICGVKGAKGCVSFTACHLWPYKLVMHLLAIAVSRGVNLQTHTPVAEVSAAPDPSTGRWTVTTKSRGAIKAKQVIFATNAYTAGLLSEYSGRIVPVRGMCCRIVTPEDKSSPHLPNTYSLRWSSNIYDYMIPRPDGSIILGGGRAGYLADLNKWYNVTDDSQLVESAKRHFDGYMQRHFRGWEDSGAYTDRVWSGGL